MALLTRQPAHAGTYTWNSTLSTGTANWNAAADWNPLSVPGASASDIAVFGDGAATTLNPDANISLSISLGEIEFADGNSFGYTISASSGQSLTLNKVGGVIAAGSNTSGTNTIGGNIILTGNSSIIQASNNAATAGNLVFSGNISQATAAALSLSRVSGTSFGTVTLSGSNSFTGGVNFANSVIAGVVGLNINSPYALGSGTLTLGTNGDTIGNTSSSAITVSNALALSSASGNGVTFDGPGNLTFNGPVTLSGAASSGSIHTITVNSGTLTFAGNVGGGAYGIKVSGSGILVLAGTNSFTLPTTVSEATLLVSGTLSGGGAVTVNSPGVLGGGGLIDRATTISGTVCLGAGSASTANLTINNTVTFNSGSTFTVDIDAINNLTDELAISGGNTLTLDATNTVNFVLAKGSSLATLAPGTYVIANVTGGGTLIGTFATNATLQPNWTIRYSSTAAALVVLPAGSAPVITSTLNATATNGEAFSYQITATGSPASYGASGLPLGLSLNTASGLISGAAAATGTSNIILSAANLGGTGTAILSLTILPAPLPNPVGLWGFDETSGSAAADSSGSGRSFTLYGSYTHTAGQLSDAITFDGSSGYGTTSWGTLTGYSDRSVSLWFKTSSTADAAFVSWGSSSSNALSQIGIRSKYIGFIGDATATNYDCTVAISTANYANGQWHHLAIAFNSTTECMELYLDGYLQMSVSRNPNTGTSALYVGRSVLGGSFLSGSLDSLAIYNTALSARQVAQVSGLGAYPLGRVSVLSPAYCSDVTGNTAISIVAPGFATATARCWQAGGAYGTDSVVSAITLTGSNGSGSFTFPAASYPHGPNIIRISATNGALSDTCYLQVYNTVGAPWNEGMPSTPPPATSGTLVFADDFTSMPAISPSGIGVTYASSKPGGGNFGFLPFRDVSNANNPFFQRDGYLRIRASTDADSTGFLSSLHSDMSGFSMQRPLYMECRFIAQDAPGSWPAFWTLTTNGISLSGSPPCDEEDVLEAYGGDGGGNPNSSTAYSLNSHEWNQTGIPGGEHISTVIAMPGVGGGAGWSYTPHVLGMEVNSSETIYYLDNIEIGRKETSTVSLTNRFWFMFNLAAGGNGWPLDLSRYNGMIDMYVDYVRAYQIPDSPASVIVDNNDPNVVITGAWNASTSTPGYFGSNYIHDGDTGQGTKNVRFIPNLPSAGNYQVSAWYTAGGNRANNVPFNIVSASGTIAGTINEQVDGSQWVALGSSYFSSGTGGYVQISDTSANGYVVANAIKFTIETPYMAWRSQMFSASDLANPAISTDTAEPAGDGIPNLTKFALGLDPFTNGVSGLPVQSITTTGSSNYLSLTYTQAAAATDITYTVQVSTDMQTWYSGSAYTTLVSTTNNPGGLTKSVKVQAMTPIDAKTPKQFIRLLITGP